MAGKAVRMRCGGRAGEWLALGFVLLGLAMGINAAASWLAEIARGHEA